MQSPSFTGSPPGVVKSGRVHAVGRKVGHRIHADGLERAGRKPVEQLFLGSIVNMIKESSRMNSHRRVHTSDMRQMCISFHAFTGQQITINKQQMKCRRRYRPVLSARQRKTKSLEIPKNPLHPHSWITRLICS